MSLSNPFSETPWYDQRAAASRFRFGLLVALAVHTLVLIGVGFIPEDNAPKQRSLDVTLSTFDDEVAPDEADFVAQSNQIGSGEQAERADISSPLNSTFDAKQIRPQLHASGAPPPTPTPYDNVVDSTFSDWKMRRTEELEPASERAEAPGEVREPDPQTSEIASLMARLDERQQQYARMPKVHRMTSVSAKRAEDAAYLQAWKERIERIGNQNYPPEARRRQLYGDLRLLVSLRPDGSVLQIRVLQSSGYAVLDYAAMRIVRLAEPFPAFPSELRANADVLEIIRTWQFRSNHLTASD